MKKLASVLMLAWFLVVAGVEASTVTGNTSAGENQAGWLFNRDTSTQTPYEFNHVASSTGFGSLYVLPILNNYDGGNGNCKNTVDQTGCNKFIAEDFLLTPIADITGISYDFRLGDGVDASKAAHFYMNVYANFGESSTTKFYDCRYNVVPSSGSENSFTTVSFDPTQTYPVTTRGGGDPSPHTCPASPSGMDALSTGSSTIRVIAINVGDTSGSDTGVGGYLDNIVVTTSSGSTVSDFEPAYAYTAPTITLNGEATVNVFSSNGYVDEGATAVDSLGNTLTVSDDSDSFNFHEAGTYTITYTATDSFGNTATATRTVAVRQTSGGGSRGNSARAASSQAALAIANAGVTLPPQAATVIGEVLGATTFDFSNLTPTERQVKIVQVRTELRSLISQMIGLLQAQLAAAIASQN